jgi:hypothetical protein
MKLLLLNVNRSGWHSGNMIYDMDAIKKSCDVKIYGPGWPDYNHNNIQDIVHQLYGDDKPDFIYSYFYDNETVQGVYMDHYKIPGELGVFPTGLEKIKDIVKIFAISDFWHKKDLNKLNRSEFQYCIGCFVPPYSNPNDFYGFFDRSFINNTKFLPLPRCIDESCFRNYGLERNQDVITMGSMINFYPLRRYFHEELSAKASLLGIRYKNYPHCGVNFSHSGFTREKYAQAISQSKMMISCGGRYHLAFNKIFESMGCKTLYVGEKFYGEKELHMEDGKNYVAVNKENFMDKILYYKKHENESIDIIKNAKDTLLQHHTIDKRGAELSLILKGIKDGHK